MKFFFSFALVLLYLKLSIKNCYICYCRYDDILINGLPDWRQPVFYYRRVRKMSNAELALLLFIILTVGHYAVVWSIYLEKQLVSIGDKSNGLASFILHRILDTYFSSERNFYFHTCSLYYSCTVTSYCLIYFYAKKNT